MYSLERMAVTALQRDSCLMHPFIHMLRQFTRFSIRTALTVLLLNLGNCSHTGNKMNRQAQKSSLQHLYIYLYNIHSNHQLQQSIPEEILNYANRKQIDNKAKPR